MNKEMIKGIIRHVMTIVSVAVLAGNSEAVQQAVEKITTAIKGGDITTIIASATTLIALLWSMWSKATDETKAKAVKIMTLGAIK